MLAIRMQRVGRKGLPQYRVVVQEAHRTPTSGKIVASLGSYNPHSKNLVLDKEMAQKFLNNGAQPSDRLTVLFKKEGVKLPKWVEVPAKLKASPKNPEKLRKNQPKETKAADQPEPNTEAQDPAETAEAPTEEAETSPAEEKEEVKE